MFGFSTKGVASTPAIYGPVTLAAYSGRAMASESRPLIDVIRIQIMRPGGDIVYDDV